MSVSVVRGTPEEYEDIIDFANYVFKIDFPALIPKAYQNHPETAGLHYLIKENGRIRALALAYPGELLIGDQPLRTLGIGTVAVHPYHRSKGYMRMILDQVMRDAADSDTDIAYLSGLRQRYEHWGFTRTGTRTALEFNDKNAAAAAPVSDDYSFPPLSEAPDGALEEARRLHEARLIRSRRDDFLDICHSFSSRPYAILQNGLPCGYLCYQQQERTINELVLQSPEHAAMVAASFYRYISKNREPIRILLAPDQSAALASLERFAEKTVLEQSMNFHVLRWQPVLTACLSALGRLGHISGHLVADIGGQRLSMDLREGKATVEPTALPADISAPPMEALRRFFGPSAYQQRSPLLPLPLFYAPCDGI